jgi:predicted NAD-dependent protein-ADP-ribosyltransferase YbiA (DUF1768 family)
MMWRKALLFNDAEMTAAILNETNPGRVKALGRKVKNFDAAKWNAVATDILSVLLATGDKELVEASPNDAIWGIGLTADAAERTPRENWGTNWLGQVLMEVREILRRRQGGNDGEDDGEDDDDATEELKNE